MPPAIDSTFSHVSSNPMDSLEPLATRDAEGPPAKKARTEKGENSIVSFVSDS